MTALAAYPELAQSVGAVIGVAGVVAGSRAADDFLAVYDASVGRLPMQRCPVGDGREVSSLTHAYRRDWLATHSLPAGPLYFSIVALPAPIMYKKNPCSDRWLGPRRAGGRRRHRLCALRRRDRAFSVARPYPMLPAVDGAMMIDPVVDSAELQKLARQAVDAVGRTAHAAGVACETHTALSFLPYEEIIRAATEYGCDVIFMASHGRRGLSRLLAGSQTQKVLANSSIPVLVLRPALPAP